MSAPQVLKTIDIMASGTGIIVGRFQAAELNDLHKALIEKVLENHNRVAVFICTSPAPHDANPVELIFRIEMFETEYGEQIEVLEMPDLPDDRIWSQELDRRIMELRPEGDVTIYGTQQRFVDLYSGKYATKPLDASAEELPEIFDMESQWDLRSFRAGMIFAAMQRFATVYATVDIAVFRNDFSELLLARKENETKFRLPGGFTDPGDDSFEMAALRELMEECGEIEVDDLMYVGSVAIDDWRYKYSSDRIITHLYLCELVSGKPVASDDIAELRWFAVDKLKTDHFVREHQELWTVLSEFLQEFDRE